MSSFVPPPILHDAPPPDASTGGPGEPPRGVSRRTVLKLAGLGGAIVTGGAWAYQAIWRITSPGPGLAFFTTEELAIAEAIGDTFFPGPPVSPLPAREVGVARFVDGYVAGMFEAEHRLFKLLFRVLDLNAVFRYGRGFVNLPHGHRHALLHAWWTSRLATRRAGYQSLRYVFAMGYFESFKVRRALGVRFGCDLSGRFPELLGAAGAR